ncbi:hypothetical protein ABEF95_017145 [Exophiala dermatitidis]|uniref:Uncharacterized protein n=1 Tax=Exophiala dermatitidis (strain ATCC 34100 / CBS 525.76 / NIH/UT8656) TaxID=858893 RepID=H6C6T1_EXODN|nr:uncharacterized protein HMPREF1120_07417 [Exophiala dermatitidis NIH/UT8656]EHY59427.1 hypothetical protein HMPREF1120_07417 [Exophiala dermatitidis NIH/UT8656]
MTHLELFHNLSTAEFQDFEASGQSDVIPASIYMKHALTRPYLMHQLLASSALHLSRKKPESQNRYRTYATGLQTRALALFNESHPVLEVTRANYAPIFLFSSLVGLHAICETLHYQRNGAGAGAGLEEFVERLVHGLSTVRSAGGGECDSLRNMIDATDSDVSRTAYRDAVAHLQHVFDVQQRRVADGGAGGADMPLLFTWPVLVSSEYLALLRQRQPQALVILAHYAVLLHRGRRFWLLGDGGQFLIESICATLGPKWQKWLEFPKSALRDPS